MDSTKRIFLCMAWFRAARLFLQRRVVKYVKAFSVSLGLVFISFSLSQAPDAHALAIAHSDLTFSNLRITPETGTISLLGDWQIAAYAEAKNSIGEEMQSFDGIYSGGNALANAMVTWADGFASVSVPHLIPDLEFTDKTASNVNLPTAGTPEEKAANSLGRGWLYNTLIIEGGTGTVNVDFSGNLSGFLSVQTDQYGLLAKADAIFGLELDGENILPYWASLVIGPNDDKLLPISKTLTNTVSMDFATPYFMWIEVDSETEGITVPEPSTGMLLLVGLGVLVLASLWKYAAGAADRAK